MKDMMPMFLTNLAKQAKDLFNFVDELADLINNILTSYLATIPLNEM